MKKILLLFAAVISALSMFLFILPMLNAATYSASVTNCPIDVYVPTGTGPFPVVIFSPGYLGNKGMYTSYGSYLSSIGYIAIIGSPTNNALEASSRIKCFQDSIDYAISQNNAGGKLAGKVNTNAIGLSGHSLGGGASVSLSSTDTRVKVIFVLAPYIGSSNCAAVKVPAYLISGSADTLVSPASVKSCYDKITKDKEYLNIQGLNHFSFLSPNSQIQSAMKTWFDKYLKGISPPPTCTNGQTRECGSSSIGACRKGTQTCANSQWENCVGAIEPVTEICSDNIDNDCDGQTDEGCSVSVCTNGQTRECGTSNIGICRKGTQTCTNGNWGSCVGSVNPVTEICTNSLDDDCDNQVDEGCSTISNCIDSDNGINYYVRGVAQDSSGVLADGCLNLNILIEAYCNSNNIAEKNNYNCPDSCQDGACVNTSSSCVDSDNGINYNLRSMVRDSRGVHVDKCLNPNTGYNVLEYYCQNNEAVAIYANCSNGLKCFRGICTNITAVSKCIDTDSGKNYFVRGVLTGICQGVNCGPWQDSCASNNILIEYFCVGESYDYEEHTCDGICSNGACLNASVQCNGCSYNGGCYAFRVKRTINSSSMYCDSDKIFKRVKNNGESCIGDYQCPVKCTNNVCSTSSTTDTSNRRSFDRSFILNILKNLFSNFDFTSLFNFRSKIPISNSSFSRNSLSNIRNIDWQNMIKDNPRLSNTLKNYLNNNNIKNLNVNTNNLNNIDSLDWQNLINSNTDIASVYQNFISSNKNLDWSKYTSNNSNIDWQSLISNYVPQKSATG